MHAALVVGNAKSGSRTREAGERLLAAFAPDQTAVIELADLGPALLGWGDPAVAAAVQTVQDTQLAVFASPTYKATYTGLLKLFLDQFAGSIGLQGVVGLPLMLSAAPIHTLAAEYTLKPVLAELGATPAPALHLIDRSFEDDGVLEAWAERWVPVLSKLWA
ncbi:MAG TPA: NAD(P)H-dependent oxidoreductase [Microbacteriaceae bacterium]|nr:NAD(P)H-dependent oxidoreductase [Microbacteriaceae bacterium]